jgi:N utilization substance protein A
VGEELYEEVEILDFGRRAILAAKQTLASRIGDLKKNVLVKKYNERVGEIVSAEVYQVWKKEILLLDEEGSELILPKSEQIPQDYFKKGESIRAVVRKVELKNNSPVIILSRTSPSVPVQTPGNRSPRDLRRPDRDQEDRPGTGRKRQSGRGIL